MKRGDYVILFLALALLPVLYFHFWNLGGHGDRVVIRSLNNKPQSYPLQQNRRIEIQGAKGPSIIEIHDGQVRFIESPCLNKQCIHSGWLRRSGEIAACLPNGVSVQVTGQNKPYDAINF
ncbi:MAG: NusG domain II-containing protein [Gammaproteobacteria bacterium]|nr:NusG domain II-containing protein [Gammaproteobacteria bacterium]